MTITLLSELPEINQGNLTIDGSNAGVVLDGRYAANGDGFRITSDGNVIKGLQIIRFPDDGVEITDGAKHNVIGGDWTVGSAPHGEGNVITLNGDDGVGINGTGTMSNTVSGNLIGLDLDGTRDFRVQAMVISPDYSQDQTLFVGTRFHGVWKTTDGGSGWAEVNSGLSILDVQALAISPNYGVDGTLLAAVWDTIYKSVNQGYGWTVASSGVITDIQTMALSPHYASDQTIFVGTSQCDTEHPLWKSTDGGSSWTAIGGEPGWCHIRTLAISPNYATDQTLFAGDMWNGVFKSTAGGTSWLKVHSGRFNRALVTSPAYAQDRTLFVGTGTDGVFKSINGGDAWTEGSAGLTDHGNYNNGVRVSDGAQGNIIGGDSAGEHNVISNNRDHGVTIHDLGTTNNIVSGNYIGTAANGTAILGNGEVGVHISNGAQYNQVGGTTSAERNVISGSGVDGISIDGDHNLVRGNLIGTDSSGQYSLGNNIEGVRIRSGAYNIIGGDTEGQRNVISGNGNNGVWIHIESHHNTVSGNFIGTDLNGTESIPNDGSGVAIGESSYDNLVGGDAANERNVISGNGSDGVSIWDSGTMSNTVSGNYIGTDASGMLALGNSADGVYIDGGAHDNTIGGKMEVPSLCNGGFETGTFSPCWAQGGELAHSVVEWLDVGEPTPTIEPPYAGRYSALLGDPSLGPGQPTEPAIPVGSAWIEQAIQVPNTASPRLSFWYRIMTYDVAQDALRQFWDIFALEINGEMVFWDGNKVPGTSQQRHDLSWRRGEVDLSHWRGQMVTVRFSNWNGYSQEPGAGLYNTWTYLDEVQVEP